MWISNTKFIDPNFNNVSFVRYNTSKARVEREVLVEIVVGLVTYSSLLFYHKRCSRKSMAIISSDSFANNDSKKTTLPSEASFVILKIKDV